MRLAGRHHEVVGLVLLEHQPHRLDVVAGEAPVALGVEVAEVELLVEPVLDARGGARDLAGHEGDPAPGGLVVEEDAAGDEHPVGLAVVLTELVGEDLGAGVGAARLERRRLALRRRCPAEHLAGRRLVEAHALVEARLADRLQQAQRPQRHRRGGVLGDVEADADVALRAEVVDLVGLHGAQRAVQRAGVVEIAVDQTQAVVGDVRVLVDAIEPLGVERARAADDAVDLVTLFEQQLGQVRPILPGDAGDQRALHLLSISFWLFS